MKDVSGHSKITGELTNLLQGSGLSRRQIVLAAVALLALLYASLFAATRPEAPEHPAPLSEAMQTEQTQQKVHADIQAEPAGDEDVLGNDFLREYDRLSGTGKGAAESADVSDPTLDSSLVGTLTFALLLVVGLFYGGIWLYKQYSGRQLNHALSGDGKTSAGQILSVQESQTLGPNQRLHIVRLGQEMLLLGTTEQTITLLARYDADGVAPVGLASSPSSFAEHLQGTMTVAQKTGQAHPVQAPIEPPQPSLQESLAELRRVQQTWQGRRDA